MNEINREDRKRKMKRRSENDRKSRSEKFWSIWERAMLAGYIILMILGAIEIMAIFIVSSAEI